MTREKFIRRVFFFFFFFSLAKVAKPLDLSDPIYRGVNPSTCSRENFQSGFAQLGENGNPSYWAIPLFLFMRFFSQIHLLNTAREHKMNIYSCVGSCRSFIFNRSWSALALALDSLCSGDQSKDRVALDLPACESEPSKTRTQRILLGNNHPTFEWKR